MALKKAVGLKLAVLALLLAAASATSGRRDDFFELLTSNIQDHSLELVGHKRPPAPPPCCNKCLCTRSMPPKCSCQDIFIGLERCANCEACICTRSMPPQCRCADVKDFCYPKCKPKVAFEVEMIKEVTTTSPSN